MKDKRHENSGTFERITLSDQQISKLATAVDFDTADAQKLADLMCEIAARHNFMARDLSTSHTRTEFHETIGEVIDGLKTAITAIDRLPKVDEEMFDQFLYMASQADAQPRESLPEFPIDLLYVSMKKHPFNPSAYSLLVEWALVAAERYKSELKLPGKGQGKRVSDFSPAIRTLKEEYELLFPDRKASAIKEGPFYQATLFFLQEVLDANIQYPSRHIDRAFKT